MQDLMQESKVELDTPKFKSPVDNRTVMEGGGSPEGSSDKSLKITAYLLDDEIIEEKKDLCGEDGQPLLGEDGQPQAEYEQKKKYPNGRKVVIASGIVLEDGPNGYEDGKFPKARLVNYLLPREFWGQSEIEQLESPQMIFNKLVSFALDTLTFTGNPIWVVPSSSGIDTDNLFNTPGLVVEYDGATPPTRQEGTQLQPYVLQLIDRMREWFDGVSGANDSTKGVRPDGVTAGNAIASLQEAAQTRIRLKSRMVDAFLQDLGQLYLSRVLQFYTAPRVFRLTGNEQSQQFFKFHIDTQVDEHGEERKVARVTPYNNNPDTGAVGEGNQQDHPMSGKLDVKVVTGSSLPFAKLEKFSMAKEMFGMGIFDAEEVLKASDIPNWQAILERVQARQAAAAQAQAGAQGGTPAPQGGPPPAA